MGEVILGLVVFGALILAYFVLTANEVLLARLDEADDASWEYQAQRDAFAHLLLQRIDLDNNPRIGTQGEKDRWTQRTLAALAKSGFATDIGDGSYLTGHYPIDGEVSDG